MIFYVFDFLHSVRLFELLNHQTRVGITTTGDVNSTKPTIVGFQPTRRCVPVQGESALIAINVAKPTSTQLNVGMLNVQSLGKKLSKNATTIHDCIVDRQLDIMTVVESWHVSLRGKVLSL